MNLLFYMCVFLWLVCYTTTCQDYIMSSILAGNGTKTASLTSPSIILRDVYTLTVSHNEDIYFAYRNDHIIRRVFANGTSIVIAGTGEAGNSVNGMKATSARINSPHSLFLNPQNEEQLFFVDQGNHQIKVIENGIVKIIAGSGNSCNGTKFVEQSIATLVNLCEIRDLVMDTSGNIYFTMAELNIIGNISTSLNTITSLSTALNYPISLSLLSNNLYISDNYTEVKVFNLLNGSISTLLSSPSNSSSDKYFYGDVIRVASDGQIYAVDMHAHVIRNISMSGTVSILTGKLNVSGASREDFESNVSYVNNPYDIAFLGSTLYFTDVGNSRIRKISKRHISTAVGSFTQGGLKDGNSMESSTFKQVNGIVYFEVNSNPYLLISDYLRLRLISLSSGIITNFAGRGDVRNFIYYGAGVPLNTYTFYDNGKIYVDKQGIVFVVDYDNSDAYYAFLAIIGTNMTSLSGSNILPINGFTVNETSSLIYFSSNNSIFSTTYDTTTELYDNLSSPTDMAISPLTGRLFFLASNTIYEIYKDEKYLSSYIRNSGDGTLLTLGSNLKSIKFSKEGNLFFVDGNFIKMVTTNGTLYTINKGNPFINIADIAVSSNGLIYVVETEIDGSFPRLRSLTMAKVYTSLLTGIPNYLVCNHLEMNVYISGVQIVGDSNFAGDCQVTNNCIFSVQTSAYLYNSSNPVKLMDRVTRETYGTWNGSLLSFNPVLKVSFSLSNCDYNLFDFSSVITNSKSGSRVNTTITIPILQRQQLKNYTGIISNVLAITNKIPLNFEFSNDVRMEPVTYSCGFYHPILKKSIPVTLYSNLTSCSLYLPYISSNSLTVIIFFKNVFGNIDEHQVGQVNVLPNTGVSYQNLDETQLKVLIYDTSQVISSSIATNIVNNITLSLNNPETSLSQIEIISTSSSSQTVSNTISNKMKDFIGDALDLYKSEKESLRFVKSTLSKTALTSSFSIISNIYSSNNSTNSSGSDSLISSFGQLLLIGQVPELLISSTPASISFTSDYLNTTVSSFTTSTISSVNIGQLVNTKLDVSQLAENGIALGMVMTVYSKNLKRDNFSSQANLASAINDFKFYKSDSYMKLENLKNPIILQFPLNQELKSNLTSNQTFISCRYWDEILLEWSSQGCELVGFDSLQSIITCSCNHTTSFTAFMQFKAVNMTALQKIQVANLYYAQIAFGCFFFLVALLVLIGLVIFRGKQPIASRMITPYLGMIALIVGSLLIGIVQRSVLVDYLFSSTTQIWEKGLTAANIISNITMIIVNTLNLTAILSYLIQVIRFQILKYLYEILGRVELEKSNRFKFIRILTSKSLFLSVVLFSIVANICYWTLWVILVRVSIIELETYVWIVGISYICIILFYSLIISLVAFTDFVVTLIKQDSFEKERLKKQSKLNSESQVDLISGPTKSKSKNAIKLENIELPKGLKKFLIQDSPLYFRSEMLLYLLCFALMIVQLVIGLISNQYRFGNETTYENAINYEVISFIFEVLYNVSFILVFGGFSLIVLIGQSIKRKLRGNSKQLEGESELLELLQDGNGYKLFESFCENEFSTENLYCMDLIVENEQFTYGKNLVDLPVFVKKLHHLFIESNSVYEVNIPSATRKQFTNLVKTLSQQQSLEMSNNSSSNTTLQSEIISSFSNLKDQLIMNLEDTFSRFSLSPLYEHYQKQLEIQQTLTKQSNLEL